MDKLLALRTTYLTDPAHNFRWAITTFEDITSIRYEEYENKEWVEKSSFDITAGYDKQVFEMALKLRKEASDGQ